MNMIEMKRPPRMGAVSKEIREIEDKQLEEITSVNKNISPYWVVVIFIVALVLAIVLL